MSELNTKMTALADAIRAKSGQTGKLTIDGMKAAVTNLSIGIDTSDADAASFDILDGKTAYVNGQKITGTIPDVTDRFFNVTLDYNNFYLSGTGGFVNVYNIQLDISKTAVFTPSKEKQQYHARHDGKLLSAVTVEPIPSEYITTTDATAEASHILKGKTAYVNGIKVTGTMANHGSVTERFNNSAGRHTVSKGAGYYEDITVTLDTRTLTVEPTQKEQTFKSSSNDYDIFFTEVKVNPIPSEYITTKDATATAATILEGETAYVNGEKVTGKYISPSPEDVRAGAWFGSKELIPGYDVGEFPQVGTFTEDATAEATDILHGKTAYVNGEKVTGAIPSKQAETYTPGTADITITSGVYISEDQTIKGDSNLKPENIKAGVSIFNVSGAFTEDATATPGAILEGEIAYVNGEKVTGAIPSKQAETYTPGTADITITSGVYLSEDQTIKGDSNLTAGNIRFGSTLFNVEGTFTADADAIASDIALGKTAYVKGLKVTGTGTGSAVIPYWYYDRSHLRTNFGPCITYNVPIRGRGTYFKAFDSKLVWFYDSYPPMAADTTITWTFAAVNDDRSCLAIGDGKLYWAYIPDSGQTRVEVSLLVSAEHGTVTQCMCLDWGVLFKAGGALYGGNASGNTARAEYHQNSVNDPTGVVNIEKILNFRQSYTNFWVITDDGSLGSGWLDKDDFDSGGGSVRVSIDTPADGNPFVNYFSQWSEYDDGSIKTYEFAFRSDGLWYRQANGPRGNWSKAEDPGFRQTDWLGYCSMSGRAVYKGYNEATDMEEWEYFVYQPEVALHIDHDGRLWKISAAGEIASKDYDMVSVRLTGLQIEQVGKDSDWQCVPSVVSRGGSNLFGQKGGKVVRMWGSSSDTIDIGWEEYPVVLPGRMLCSEGTDLFFAPAGVTVDLSKAGGTY